MISTSDLAVQRRRHPLAGYAEWEVGAGYVDALAAVEAVLAR